MNFDINKLKWTRQPADYSLANDKIEINKSSHRFVAENILSFQK